jgi:hypothetical protein
MLRSSLSGYRSSSCSEIPAYYPHSPTPPPSRVRARSYPIREFPRIREELVGSVNQPPPLIVAPSQPPQQQQHYQLRQPPPYPGLPPQPAVANIESGSQPQEELFPEKLPSRIFRLVTCHSPVNWVHIVFAVHLISLANWIARIGRAQASRDGAEKSGSKSTDSNPKDPER